MMTISARSVPSRREDLLTTSWPLSQSRGASRSPINLACKPEKKESDAKTITMKRTTLATIRRRGDELDLCAAIQSRRGDKVGN